MKQPIFPSMPLDATPFSALRRSLAPPAAAGPRAPIDMVRDALLLLILQQLDRLLATLERLFTTWQAGTLPPTQPRPQFAPQSPLRPVAPQRPDAHPRAPSMRTPWPARPVAPAQAPALHAPVAGRAPHLHAPAIPGPTTLAPPPFRPPGQPAPPARRFFAPHAPRPRTP